MGTTTAGLPLTGTHARSHYEKCPGCATVYRSAKRTRFRCPSCHHIIRAIPTPEGEPGLRRVLDTDPEGRVFRIIERRPGEGESPPVFGDDVVLFLEDAAAAPAAPGLPPPADVPGIPPAPSPARARAARARDRGPAPAARASLLRRLWSGGLSGLGKR